VTWTSRITTLFIPSRNSKKDRFAPSLNLLSKLLNFSKERLFLMSQKPALSETQVKPFL
jgi:hypothetical protein